MANLITDARLKTFLPSLADLDVWTPVLKEAMTRFDIVTPERGRGLLQVTGRSTGLDSRLRYRAKAKALFA